MKDGKQRFVYFLPRKQKSGSVDHIADKGDKENEADEEEGYIH